MTGRGDGQATIRALRQRATELRGIADALTWHANELEAVLSDRPVIGGRALADKAAAILAKETAGRDPGWRGLHYKALADEIQRQGFYIRGQDPAATLLANMDRDGRFVNVEPGSGRYRLTSTASLDRQIDTLREGGEP